MLDKNSQQQGVGKRDTEGQPNREKKKKIIEKTKKGTAKNLIPVYKQKKVKVGG